MVQHNSTTVAAHLSRGEASDAIEMTHGSERTLAAALPGRKRVHMGSAVAVGAAAVMAAALGADAPGGSRGRVRLPSPPAGCAGLACRARSRAVPCGVGYGRTDRRLASGRGPPFACPCSFYRSFPVGFFPAYSFKQLKSHFALLKPYKFLI